MTTESTEKFNFDLSGYPARVLAGVVLFTLALNMWACWNSYRRKPLREAASRSLMAANSTFFFDSGLSEPVPVFAVKVLSAVGLKPETAVRAGGLAAWAGLVGLVFFTLRRRCGDLAGLMAALFLSMNHYLGYYAMQGDSHLFALLFLLLFWHYAAPPELTVRRAALAGLYAGLACLSRLDACWFVLLALALFGALSPGRERLKAAGLTLAAALLLAAPYLVWQKAKFGNALYAQELSLRRLHNVERYGYTPEARAADQSPMSVSAFVLRDGAGAALRSAFYGLGRSLSFEVPKIVSFNLIVILAFLGFYASFALKLDSLLVLAAAAYLPVLPLASLPEAYAGGGLTLRYYLWTLCAFCALAGLGFQELVFWMMTETNKWLKETAARKAGRK